MAIAIDIAGSNEPITLEDIKTHMHIDTTHEDAWISKVITLVRKAVEEATGVTVVPKNVKQLWESYEKKYYLRYTTLENVIISLKYRDSNGEEHTSTANRLHSTSKLAYISASDIPIDATDIEAEYLATPNPDSPVLNAVIEGVVIRLSYDASVREKAKQRYDDLIAMHSVSFIS